MHNHDTLLPASSLPDFAARSSNLADPRLGAEVIAASDDFFAAKENLINPAPPVFIPDKFTPQGKWMDGWESRRRRNDGYDWCTLRLGVAARLFAINIDTSHFTGNYPHAASVDASAAVSPGEDDWQPLLKTATLSPSQNHWFELGGSEVWRCLRLNIYPDGGVARLRVHGRAIITPAGQEEIDCAALSNGGRVIAASNHHFGLPQNMLMPGRGINMGDGWETHRRREPGYEWAIIELGCPCQVRSVIVDTAHFKGNYPHKCSLQAATVTFGTDRSIIPQSIFWPALLTPMSLSADAEHDFRADITPSQTPSTHVRFNIHPDGGVSRLRIIGVPDSSGQLPLDC